MLNFLLDFESISADAEDSVVRDHTVYGGDNFERNEVALYLFFYKRDAKNEFTLIPTVNDAPTTDETWDVPMRGPGSYRAVVYVIPIYDVSATYSDDALIHFSGSVYRNISGSDQTNNSPTDDPAAWEEVTEENLRENDYEAVSHEFHYVELFDTTEVEVCIANMQEELGNEIVDGVCKTLDRALPTLLVTTALDAAWVKYYRRKGAEAQEIVDYLERECCN